MSFKVQQEFAIFYCCCFRSILDALLYTWRGSCREASIEIGL